MNKLGKMTFKLTLITEILALTLLASCTTVGKALVPPWTLPLRQLPVMPLAIRPNRMKKLLSPVISARCQQVAAPQVQY